MSPTGVLVLALCAALVGAQTINLAQELEATKFTNIACDPVHNSITTNIQNGIVSQAQTSFQYAATCGNGQLLFDPPSAIISAGISALVNGTLFPQTDANTIVGAVCSMSLLAVIESIDTTTGTTVQTLQVADNVQYSCGPVQQTTKCGWINLACYWTQGRTTSSSAFWLWVCLFSIGVVFAVYFLGFRLLWASIATARIKKQYAYLTKEDAMQTAEEDAVAEELARSVRNGVTDATQLQSKKAEIERELAAPQNQMRMNQQAQRMMQPVAPSASAWTFNFSFPQALSTMQTPAAGREGSETLRYRTPRSEFGMHAGGGEAGPSTSIEMADLMGRYGHVDLDSSDDDY
jgi:hypothetical protein